MKKDYFIPEIDVSYFGENDVILCSEVGHVEQQIDEDMGEEIDE